LITTLPADVRARTSTASAEGSGASAASSALWTVPGGGAHVEPGGRALADANLEVAEPGFENE